VGGKESALLRLRDTGSPSIFSSSLSIVIINLDSWPNLGETCMIEEKKGSRQAERDSKSVSTVYYFRFFLKLYYETR
jgi:hypothetical protein